MTNDKVYDLEERTAAFGENIIDFVKTLPLNIVNKSLISQGIPIASPFCKGGLRGIFLLQSGLIETLKNTRKEPGKSSKSFNL